MAKIKGKLDINEEKCKGCGLCIEVCPTHTLQLSPNVNSKGYHFSTEVTDTCIACTNCAVICPDGVITVYRLTEDNKEETAQEKQNNTL